MRSINAACGILLSFFSSSALAGPHKIIDLKVATDADGTQRELSLCSRPSPGFGGIPGHMFVAFSELPQNGKRTYLAFGHTTSASPVTTLLTYTGLITNVSGYIEEERYTSSTEQCLVLKVSKVDYDRAMAFAKPSIEQILPNANTPLLLAYSLGENDCMGLAIGTAKLFIGSGLKVPERKPTEPPRAYVRRMIDAN